jgi:hypothetical protein
MSRMVPSGGNPEEEEEDETPEEHGEEVMRNRSCDAKRKLSRGRGSGANRLPSAKKREKSAPAEKAKRADLTPR